jgi:hypothetical protein
MADYADLVQAVMQSKTLTIVSPVTYTSLRRGINRVIKQINEAAEILDDSSYKFQGEISAKMEYKTPLGYRYLLTYHPEGRELPDCFKSKFEFRVVEPTDANTSGSMEQDKEGKAGTD